MTEPDVAVTVTVDVPNGVPGFELPPPQPIRIDKINSNDEAVKITVALRFLRKVPANTMPIRPKPVNGSQAA